MSSPRELGRGFFFIFFLNTLIYFFFLAPAGRRGSRRPVRRRRCCRPIPGWCRTDDGSRKAGTLPGRGTRGGGHFGRRLRGVASASPLIWFRFFFYKK